MHEQHLSYSCNPSFESLNPTKSSTNNKPLSCNEGKDETLLSIYFIKPSTKIRNNTPHLDNYKYLGIKFTYNGHWDAHIKDLVTAGKCKVNSFLRLLNNPCLSLYVKRQVILSILRPSLEYCIVKCGDVQRPNLRH